MHANCVQIEGKGIIITGPAGIGKSEVTLHLLNRGHHFISDDIVLLTTHTPEHIIASAADTPLKHQMHIRDLGMINLKALYPKQILENTTLHFSIALTQHVAPISTRPTRIEPIIACVPHYQIGVNNRANIALLIETLSTLSR